MANEQQPNRKLLEDEGYLLVTNIDDKFLVYVNHNIESHYYFLVWDNQKESYNLSSCAIDVFCSHHIAGGECMRSMSKKTITMNSDGIRTIDKEKNN